MIEIFDKMISNDVEDRPTCEKIICDKSAWAFYYF